MKRLFILPFLLFFAGLAMSQSFTIDDLLAMTALSSKQLDNQLKKKGFYPSRFWMEYDLQKKTYSEKVKVQKRDSLTGRSIRIYKKDGLSFYELHTPVPQEFYEGQLRLIKSGFFHDTVKAISMDGLKLYQKKNILIEALPDAEDENAGYLFRLVMKNYPNPSSVRYAEDLLKFNSHEYLAGYFGEKNVKKDLYYFSDKEVKKCTVLFGNSNRQAVFVWEDEDNLRDISYILVSNIIHTASAENFDAALGLNKWELKNGIYSGMSIKELLMLNEKDFEIYGSQSEKAFMVKQENNGKLDFKKAAVMLSCNNCNDDRLLKQSVVNALEIAEENLPMYVYHIIIFSAKH